MLRTVSLPHRIAAAALALTLAAALPAVAADARKDATPDLPASDVLRLTEEARWLASTDGKSNLAAGRLRNLVSPNGVAADSAHGWDALHYRLDVIPSRSQNLISGTMILTLEIVDPAITDIDLHSLVTVTGARVNGSVRNISYAGDQILVPICQNGNCPPHGAGAQLQVAVDFNATTAQLGYYYYARNSYTLAEPYDGRYWWPSYDLPFDKATVEVNATVPDTNICLSNGQLLSVTNAFAGYKTWHWQETHPISTYLVAITVGNFWQMQQSAGGIPITQYVFPEDSTKAMFDCANMPAMFTAFQSRFGPYPFDRYGQVAVTPFPAGGMEHQGLTTINRSWINGFRQNENGMAHELMHQWWGDMVTLVDFRNIWLNEGFASYGETIWRESFYGNYDAYVASQMTSALNSDANFRYALYDPPAANLFGNTIYRKGSVVLHMLRRVLGDTPFFAGMLLYGQRFQYGNASTEDFEQAMEDASGQTLDWFFDEWVYDKGLPTYNWGWQTSPKGGNVSNLVVQIRQVQTNAPFFRMPVEFKVSRSGLADTTVTVQNDAVAQQNQLVLVNGTVTGVVFDPRNNILKRIQQIPVDAPSVIPDVGPSIALSAAPNPSRASSVLRVRLGAASREPIHMTIYDAGGRAIRDLGPARAGVAAAEFTWDLSDATGRRVAPGLYFAQARVGAQHEERSITVLH